MSNWLRAQVSTEIKNPKRNLFEKALDNMGYKPDYTMKEVHGSFSYESSEPVDCVLCDKENGTPSTIGFSFKRTPDNQIQLLVSGDFWSSHFTPTTFMKQLGMQYNYEMAKEHLEEQGYVIEDTEVREHEIVFVGRMAA